ncbi:hypothetical protein CCYA_CCYA12G3366 [Cyanidiococcus yangmingshanensis]|nr:hypothetical protein CCYA_CCYA12G3366 [Cyanidiococcus yangmingshanensis]
MTRRRPPLSDGAGSSSASDSSVPLEDLQLSEDSGNEEEEVYVLSISEELGHGAEATSEQDDAVCVLKSHSGPIYAVAITPDDSIIVSGGGDDRAYIWFRLVTESQRILGSFTDSVGAVAVSDTTVALGTLAGELNLYRTEDLRETIFESETFSPLSQLLVDAPVECLRSSAELIACGTADGALWVLDAASGDCLGVAYSHQGAVNALDFVDSGSNADAEGVLVSGSADATVRVWKRPAQGILPCLHVIEGVFHQAPIISLESHEDLVLTGDESGHAFLSNWRTGRALRSLGQRHGGAVESVTLGPDLIVTGGTDGFLHVYTPDARHRMSFQHKDVVVSVKKMRSWPQLFVSASVDETVCLWDTRVGSGAVRCFHGHRDAILTMDVGTDIVVSGGDDQTVRLFSVR